MHQSSSIMMGSQANPSKAAKAIHGRSSHQASISDDATTSTLGTTTSSEFLRDTIPHNETTTIAPSMQC